MAKDKGKKDASDDKKETVVTHTAAGGDGDGNKALNLAGSDTNPELLSMAQQFAGLPMKDLIGGPLQAAAEANYQMAMTQVVFLKNVCFNVTKDKTTGKEAWDPILVDLSVTRPFVSAQPGPEGQQTDPKISTVESKIRLPILTLMPLNSLAVTSVNVDFIMEVKSSFSKETKNESSTQTHADASFETKIDYWFASTTIKGSVSQDTSMSNSESTHYQKSNSATYSVKVQAGQLPLPPGVGVIIQAFTDNIVPYEVSAPPPSPPAPPPPAPHE